ncbi:unnamed protein product [Rangifer tarandus platyrhynchus]|uniref:Uncharacterized protein n=2 Tax=Rangifer tarandus platyrhynchus TaxID=3082113 RepID=A0ACB0E4S2_RANTA|nr:unnamed protein product [Rangifer tarandus platyrhynchus]CAI9695439.1 unnamed protein product [Rangifer tarandus platyrhynchus]
MAPDPVHLLLLSLSAADMAFLLLCLRPSPAHRVGSRPPTCVTFSGLDTRGGGARGCAPYRGSPGQGEPAHRSDARSPRRLGRPASSNPSPCPPVRLITPCPPPTPDTQTGCAPSLHAPHRLL